MKYMEKKSLDELIRITRKYWETGDIDILDARHKHAMNLSTSVSGHEHMWGEFCELINGIVKLNKEASNFDIYGMLERLGYYLPEIIGAEEAKTEETA